MLALLLLVLWMCFWQNGPGEPIVYTLSHYRKIAGDDAVQPSIQLLQAPIFHGHALAIFLELANPVEVQSLSQALAGDHVASNVTSAGQPDILLALKKDPTQANGIWLWAAADNLRISALTAVECAESMAATRPTGKIQ